MFQINIFSQTPIWSTHPDYLPVYKDIKDFAREKLIYLGLTDKISFPFAETGEFACLGEEIVP